MSLEYEIAPGIDGCPDAEQFRTSVDRQLGYDPFRATAEKRVADKSLRVRQWYLAEKKPV